MMYMCERLYGVDNFLCHVSNEEIEACVQECTPKGPLPCDETVFELSTLLMEESGRRKPERGEEAVLLYQFLRQNILLGLA
jgi:hypothetical protein